MGGNEELPLNNGAVLNISQQIKAVMSSVAEAELGGLFINAKTAVSMQKNAGRNGSSPTTNANPDGQFHCPRSAHQQDHPKATKAMDMRFWWLKDRDTKGQF